MLTLADAAHLGSFLGGIATTLGLLGLIYVRREWRINGETQKKEAERLAREETRYRDQQAKDRDQRLQDNKSLLRNEAIQQELAILSWAHEAFAVMHTERNKLYLEAISADEGNPVKRNFAFRSAARVNTLFAFRLSSWLQTLSKMENAILDYQQIEKLVTSTATIAKEDQRLTMHFAIEELDFLKKKGDAAEYGSEEYDSFWKLYKTSEEFRLSPFDQKKMNEVVFTELAKNWQNLKSREQ